MAFSLAVEPRTQRGKQLETLRAQGKIPAVVYGAHAEPESVSVEKAVFDKVLKEAGESSVITLSGLSSPRSVLIHDVAFDARKGGVVHVDFLTIEAGKEITVSVPLEFIGEAPAVKSGGTLTKVLHEVSITCTPDRLPAHITVDVSSLDDFEKKIHVSDLSLPQGVALHHGGEEIVVLVQSVESEAEAQPSETPVA